MATKHRGTALLRGALLCAACTLSLVMFGCDATPTSPEPQRLQKEQPQQPEGLHPAERAFLEARLDKTIGLLVAHRRDSTDGLLHAYSLFLAGEESEGEQIFQETMAAPHYEHEHLFRGFLSLLTGKLDVALDHFDQERRQPPERFFASVMYAETLTLAGRFDNAERAVKQLERLYPRENIVYHTQGHLESAREAWKAAIVAYERARELGGKNPDLDEGIAAAMIEVGDLVGAEEVIHRCKKEFPDYTEILFQEIRWFVRYPNMSSETLRPLVSQYTSRTQRHDRIEEVEQMTKRD